jgi:hypothetical protein
MKCPHCTVSIHPSWSVNNILKDNTGTPWRVRIMTCPDCRLDILTLSNTSVATPSRQIYPEGSNRGAVPADVPKLIAADYNEAAIVLPSSAKASAALSRRCAQAVLRQAGYTQRDLSVQIDAVLGETDPAKAIPTGLRSTLDIIRNLGNFAAHTINDQTTLQIIDVEPEEAEYCLDVLDALFDHYYVKPAEANRRKVALNDKLKAAGKPPVK